MWLLWISAALCSEPDLVGFDRLHADPRTVHVEPAEPTKPVEHTNLEIHNGHTARATVQVGGVPIGELLPHSTGTLRKVVAGTYTVRFELPDGVVRVEQIDAR